MRKIKQTIFTAIFSILVFSVTQAQEAEITGWDALELKVKCTVQSPCYSNWFRIYPLIANEDNDDDPWSVHASVSIISGDVAVITNDYPLNGPYPQVEDALLITFGDNATFEITFSTVYSGSTFSTQTYTYTVNSF